MTKRFIERHNHAVLRDDVELIPQSLDASISNEVKKLKISKTGRFKTKTKKISKLMLGTVVLGFVVTCSATSAQATWTNGYSTITEATVQTTNVMTPSGGKKDLSELSSRLQTRL
ncbi:hypothetical protein KKG31_04755 [Patescibacteria group bacterium]|nr:hypothetical protein [Patescibacteria group bacterium]MBU1758439.1 hypothetical protein [Patescibacteria group bacterium]